MARTMFKMLYDLRKYLLMFLVSFIGICSKKYDQLDKISCNLSNQID
jgi:hypothetical protein